MPVKPWMELSRYLNPYLGIRDGSKPRSEGSMTTMTNVYVVMDSDNDGGHFYGVFLAFEDALACARLHLGCDIAKCDLKGGFQEMMAKPSRFAVDQVIYDMDKRVHETVVLFETSEYQKAREFVQDHVVRAYDSVSWKVQFGYEYEDSIYYSLLKRVNETHPTVMEWRNVGSVSIRILEYSYTCENVPSTSN